MFELLWTFFFFSFSLCLTGQHYCMSKFYSFFFYVYAIVLSHFSYCSLFSVLFALTVYHTSSKASHICQQIAQSKQQTFPFSQKLQLVSFQIGVKGYLAARVCLHFITFKGQSDDGLWSVWRCASIGLGLTNGGEKVLLKPRTESGSYTWTLAGCSENL